MRNGEVYNKQDVSVVAIAVNEEGEPIVPLGTELIICRKDLEKCVLGRVQDTGRFPPEDLDLSQEAFDQLKTSETGRVDIIWWKLEDMLLIEQDTRF